MGAVETEAVNWAAGRGGQGEGLQGQEEMLHITSGGVLIYRYLLQHSLQLQTCCKGLLIKLFT